LKLLLDNNLSYRIVPALDRRFAGSSHVRSLLGSEASDATIWDFAKENEFIILTKDDDFNARSLLYGCPPKVVYLSCGNLPTHSVVELLHRNADAIYRFGEDDSVTCLLEIY
jgi:predicted nuclease of predicted toxin-antitoxin system